MNNTYLAIDFGGGSGRVIAGQISGGQLHLDEIYRFSNRQIKMEVSSENTTVPRL